MKPRPNKTVVRVLNEIEKKCVELKLDREWSAVALFTLLRTLKETYE